MARHTETTRLKGNAISSPIKMQTIMAPVAAGTEYTNDAVATFRGNAYSWVGKKKPHILASTSTISRTMLRNSID